MAAERKTKQSFGTVKIDHFSPENEAPDKALNVILSFDQALRLHLGLLQILGEINQLDHRTKEGRDAAVNLCIYPTRITINRSKVQ